MSEGYGQQPYGSWQPSYGSQPQPPQAAPLGTPQPYGSRLHGSQPYGAQPPAVQPWSGPVHAAQPPYAAQPTYPPAGGISPARPAASADGAVRVLSFVGSVLTFLPGLLLLTNGVSVLTATREVFANSPLSDFVPALEAVGWCLIVASLANGVAAVGELAGTALRRPFLRAAAAVGLGGILIGLAGGIIYAVQANRLLQMASSMGVTGVATRLNGATALLFALCVMCLASHVPAFLYGLRLTRPQPGGAPGPEPCGPPGYDQQAGRQPYAAPSPQPYGQWSTPSGRPPA